LQFAPFIHGKNVHFFCPAGGLQVRHLLESDAGFQGSSKKNTEQISAVI
jgi:hypothetical protein